MHLMHILYISITPLFWNSTFYLYLFPGLAWLDVTGDIENNAHVLHIEFEISNYVPHI